MRLLIAFGTTDGMTATISERLAATARSLGHDATLVNTRSVHGRYGLSGFDAVLVGGSVHAGRYQHSVRRFIRANLTALNEIPSAFFSVCLAEHSQSETERAEGRRIAEAFARGLGWDPLLVQPVAGALLFSHYGLLRGFVMRKIAKAEDPGADVTKDYVYTDWDQVDRFLGQLLSKAVRRVPVAAPRPIVRERVAPVA